MVRLTSALQCVSQLWSGGSLSSQEDDPLVKSLLQHERASRPDSIASRSAAIQIATIKKAPAVIEETCLYQFPVGFLELQRAHASDSLSVFLATIIHTVMTAVALHTLNNGYLTVVLQPHAVKCCVKCFIQSTRLISSCISGKSNPWCCERHELQKYY